MRWLLALVCSFLAGCVIAAPKYDAVRSVTVNGVDVTRAIDYLALKRAHGKPAGVFKSAIFAECTANYEVAFASDMPDMRWEIYPEDNPRLNLEQIFKPRRPGLGGGLKGRLWLSWSDFAQASQSVQVGTLKLGPSSTLAEFAKHFPRSRKAGAAIGDVPGERRFFVIFALPDSKVEGDIPYESHVSFTFKGEQLRALSINQALAC